MTSRGVSIILQNCRRTTQKVTSVSREGRSRGREGQPSPQVGSFLFECSEFWIWIQVSDLKALHFLKCKHTTKSSFLKVSPPHKLSPCWFQKVEEILVVPRETMKTLKLPERLSQPPTKQLPTIGLILFSTSRNSARPALHGVSCLPPDTPLPPPESFEFFMSLLLPSHPLQEGSQFPSRFLSLSLDFCHLSQVWGHLQPPVHLPTDPAQYRACNWLPINIDCIDFKGDGSVTLFAANLNNFWKFLLEDGKITFPWSNMKFKGRKPSMAVL